MSLDIVGRLFGIDVGGLRGYQYPLGAYLSKYYRDMGHEVQIVTCTTEIDCPLVFKGDRVTVSVVPRRRSYRYVTDGYRQERRAMSAAISEYSPAAVHAQWCYEFAHAARDSNYATLVTIRDVPLQILKQLRTPYRLYRFFYGKWVISRGTHFSCISPYVHDQLRGWFPNRAQVRVIPNGLDHRYFKEKLDFSDRATRLVCVSGGDRRKNFKLVFESFLRSLKAHPDLVLTVCGSALDGTCDWAKIAAELGYGRNFIWKGACSHREIVEDILPCAEIFITSTREESFCMTVLEAMATGTPVIAMRGIGAVPWLLNNGECGVLVDSSDPAEWATAIRTLVDARSKRVRISREAYKRATQFRLDAVAAAYVNVLREISQS